MLTIRLQRVGRKNQPIFRIVLAEKHRSAQKKTIEALGLYNPRNKDFSVKEDRLKHWLGQHVELSPTVHNLLVTQKLLSEKKVHAWQPKRKSAEEAGKKAEAAKAADVPAQAGNQAPSPQSSPTGGEEVKVEAIAAEAKPLEKTSEAPAAA